MLHPLMLILLWISATLQLVALLREAPLWVQMEIYMRMLVAPYS
jgi:hypothetical protein